MYGRGLYFRVDHGPDAPCLTGGTTSTPGRVVHSVVGVWRIVGAGDRRDGNAVIGKVRRCLTPETSVNGHGKLVSSATLCLMSEKLFSAGKARKTTSYKHWRCVYQDSCLPQLTHRVVEHGLALITSSPSCRDGVQPRTEATLCLEPT